MMNEIYCKSSESMDELPDSSVHLTVTSPPYNVGKEYESDLELNEYREFLKRVWSEVWRVSVDGARLCVNIAGTGRNPYVPLQSYLTQDILDTGFLMRGDIIWSKGPSSRNSTAWGSWASASCPVLRDVHEYILVFSKGEFMRKEKGESTISGDKFMEYTESIWHFLTESATKIGHPAPFPVELPSRLIRLYSFKGDVVLDPFMGSGTTAVAATRLVRQWVGYEKDKDYIRLAKDRLMQESYLFDGVYA